MRKCFAILAVFALIFGSCANKKHAELAAEFEKLCAV